jgi:hypothetical protein
MICLWLCLSGTVPFRGKFYCTFCNGSKKHHPLKCPLLGELGLKITEVGGQSGGVTRGSSLGAGKVKPASASPPAAAPLIPDSGSTSAPAGLTVAVETDDGRDKSSVDNF